MTAPWDPQRRRTVTVAPGVEISLIAGDSGPERPVLLVHGLASNARLWDGVAENLIAAGHPVAAIDQRGHGLSARPPGGYDFDTLVADLETCLGDLGWADRRPVVAGQSWGGNVVLHLGARRPGVAGGLVLVDGGTIELSSRFADWPTCEAALAPPPLSGMQASDFESLLREHHPDWPDAGIAGTMANMEVRPDGTIRPWLRRDLHMEILRHLWAHRPADLYPLVKEPVLMIMADDKRNPRWLSGKREEVARALAALPDGRVEWIEGDHDLHAQHPDLVAGLIRDLAARAGGSGAGAGGSGAGAGGGGARAGGGGE